MNRNIQRMSVFSYIRGFINVYKEIKIQKQYNKDFLIPYLKEHLAYMGKQIVYPGEEELPALADAGFRILKGEEKPKEYKGK